MEALSTLNLGHPPVVINRPNRTPSDPSFEQSVSMTVAGNKRRSASSTEEPNNNEQLHTVLGEIMVTGDDSATLPPLKKKT